MNSMLMLSDLLIAKSSSFLTDLVQFLHFCQFQPHQKNLCYQTFFQRGRWIVWLNFFWHNTSNAHFGVKFLLYFLKQVSHYKKSYHSLTSIMIQGNLKIFFKMMDTRKVKESYISKYRIFAIIRALEYKTLLNRRRP